MKIHKQLNLLIICTILAGNLTFAQTKIDFATEVNIMSRSLSPAINAEGSPYINADFSPVRVNNNDLVYVGRYNAYNGEMEIILDDNKDPIALDLARNYKVKFIKDDKLYQTYQYQDEGGNQQKGFLRVLYTSGNVALLAKENIDFQDKVKARTTYQSDKPAKFIRGRDEYLLKLNDDIVVIVPKKNKDLANFFPNHKDKVEDFVKKDKIKTSDKEDLVKFLNFINTL